MIIFKEITIRNFMSFGNTPTTVNLNTNTIRTITGVNMDSGNEQTKNGTGKSSIIDAISYVLFGKAIRNTSNAKLSNKLKTKGTPMEVSMMFTDEQNDYLVVRGEGPSKMKMWKKPSNSNDDFKLKEDGNFKYEITKNKPELTNDIIDIIGIHPMLFNLLVLNTTEQVQFMELPEEKRRNTIEELMGLTLLSKRATELKEERKETKNQIISLEATIKTNERANDRVLSRIDIINNKIALWNQNKEKELHNLRDELDQLSDVDIDAEIELLEQLNTLNDQMINVEDDLKNNNQVLASLKREKASYERNEKRWKHRIDVIENELDSISTGVCPTCGQEIDEDHSDHISELETELKTLKNELSVPFDTKKLEDVSRIIGGLRTEREKLSDLIDDVHSKDLKFDDLESAKDLQGIIEQLKHYITTLENTENPHVTALDGLEDDLVDVERDMAELDGLEKLYKHYDYLINILLSKDSFVRKNIISRWTPFLNKQLRHYVSTLELHHQVTINDDFSIEIDDLGEKYDWGNLSRGQRQRVNVALILSFIDLYELAQTPINLLFIDELLDSGICERGARQVLELLKEQVVKRGKSIFVITHRQDIVDGVDNNMLVRYEKRTSTIQEDIAA